jgi:hypothetical protein
MPRLILLLVVAFAASHVVRAEDVEVYDPDKPSRHWDGWLENKAGERIKASFRNFGQEEAKVPTRLGHKLRIDGLTPGQAEAEIWRAAWKQYPDHRFFARAFAQVAEEAYDGKR